MQIEIICTGDEILSGKIINSNFSYMSRKLEEVGLSVVWGTTVGDDRKELLDAFILASIFGNPGKFDPHTIIFTFRFFIKSKY